ncbi:hypothetical protein QQZ08_003776 [Neonectria magnoliae]|uniref:FHA domain-containing protein n=1 Tax=Neonectria magnoliae TaxID=2732573 RepID=A0ABR1I874_9HYPO
MEPDIIAYLYPHNDNKKWASNAIEANPRHMPPRLQPAEDRYSRGERESTEPLETQGASALDHLPYLVVRLSDVPRTDKGLLFGSNSHCDVVLRVRGISNVHFSLTFDEFNRPIVKDLNSLRGTEVTYHGEGEGVRRDFQWIVAYIDKLNRFKQGIATAEDLLDDLGLLNPPTRPCIGAHTPGTREICLRKKLGEGSYSVVTYL